MKPVFLNVLGSKQPISDFAEDYIIGHLTVYFDSDSVALVHRVNGRLSYMDLDEGDHIEVKDGDKYKSVSIDDVINTIVTKRSAEHTKWNFGQSYYEGAKVRVRINHKTTKQVEQDNRKQTIRHLFKAIEHEYITHEEAMETLFRLESNKED